MLGRFGDELPTRDDVDQSEEAVWSTLAAVLGVFEVPYLDEYVVGPACSPALLLARLHVIELPDAIREACGESWYTFFDAQGSELGEVVERLAEDPPPGEFSYPETVYWFERLDVHPILRGRRAGAALIAHALRLLVRGPGDFAVAEAIPCESQFDPPGGPEPDSSPEASRRLVRYYRRAGFRRWPRRYHGGDHPCCGSPASGIPSPATGTPDREFEP